MHEDLKFGERPMALPKRKYKISRKQKNLFSKNQSERMAIDNDDNNNNNDNNINIENFESYDAYLKAHRERIYDEPSTLPMQYTKFVRSIIRGYKKAIFIKLIEDVDINQYICLYLNKIYQIMINKSMYCIIPA